MAVTQNTYTGNGTTVLYSFTFPYLDESDIKVEVNGTLTTAYTLATATTIQFTTAPANGASVRIYRETSDSQLQAEFFPGSAIRAQDLNSDFNQSLYIAQETRNNSVDPNNASFLDDVNFNNHKGINLATPAASTDAANKGYVDGLISTGAANAAAAAASASAAAGSASSAAASYDAFDDRYLGSKTTDPALDNDGNALITGAIYFNSTSNVMRVWNGATWQDSSANANVLRWRKTAVGGETSLSGADDNAATLTYTVNLEFVYLNGVLLTRGVDYTASNGTSITGLVALEAGDVVEVLSYSSFSLVNVPGSTIQDGTITTNKIANGTILNEDVNASAGIVATKLSFTQAGTGAVARTIDSKLKDVVSVKDFGAVGDGVADDTAAIQAALTAAVGNTLFIPKPTSKYICGSLTVPSNICIEFESGTVIESNASLLTGTKKLLNIAGSNVHIVGFGATLQMVKAGFSSEHNHGVSIIAASGQIVIEGLASNDSGGDGFYVNAPLAAVTFRDCRANNNRRQGLSIIQCKSFADYSGTYTGTTGTAPSAGVDIEPNSPTDVLGPIRLYGTVVSGNDGPGIEIFLSAWQAVTNYADIKIVGPYTKNNGVVTIGGRFRPGIDINRITSTTPCKGRIQIIDPVCEDENRAGIHFYDWDVNGPVVEIIRPTVINPNQANGNSSIVNGGIIFYNSGSHTASAGNIFVSDPVVLDNDGLLNSNLLAPFRFSGVVALNIENPAFAYAGSNPWSADVNSTPAISAKKELLVAFSNNLTMTDWRYVGRVVTNDGATGTVTRTLPLAKVGIVLKFTLMESFAVRIYPNAADRIVPTGSAAAKYIEASVRGASVTLRCREAGFWDMENVSGTWTSEP